MDDNKPLISNIKPIIRVTRPAPPPPPPKRSIHTKITTQTTTTTTSNTNNNNNTKENQNINKKLLKRVPIPAIRKINNRNIVIIENPHNDIIKTVTDHNEKLQKNKNVVKDKEEEEENIYQPIWKFQTIGNPRDSNNDAFIKVNNEEASNNDIEDYNESSLLLEDDHGEWETDDEFMFTTKKLNNNNNDNNNQYININDNNNEDSISLISSTVSTLTGLSLSGISMIGATGGCSSSSIEDDLISKINNNNYKKINNNIIDNNLHQSICIFYSPIDIKLNGILYDYNRDQFNQISSLKNWPTIFKNNSNNNELLINNDYKKLNLSKDSINSTVKMIQHEKISSNNNSNNNNTNIDLSSSKNVENINKRKLNEDDNGNQSNSISSCGNNVKETFFLPDCVQAWKFMLLDIRFMDDEEDMYISNNELLQLNEIHSEDKILKLKDIDLDNKSTILPSVYQRTLFKSKSTDNLLDIPLQDKKSIGEKFRDKLQRGVLKLNSKQSKDNKKNKPSAQIYRRSFLDDSVQEKYPIFGVTLDDVEMSQIYINVPLFVVDCIKLIEHKDSIDIDGLYRQSGNKTAIDDYKRKLTDNYIFNLTLLKNEDIHTITGLLKLFFRELRTAIIPTKSYEELPDNLIKIENLQLIKKILNDISDPSKGTLKYLLKHLTKVANHSQENRMPASNLAIIWGPCILMSETTGPMDIARINTLMKILIENYDIIYGFDE